MKPLFVPLKAEYFDAFARGEKFEEFRLYGKRWNEKTCPPGRPAVLSRGYGKKNRLPARVIHFRREYFYTLPRAAREDLEKCFGEIGTCCEIAVVTFERTPAPAKAKA